jgi:hypothetical protein
MGRRARSPHHAAALELLGKKSQAAPPGNKKYSKCMPAAVLSRALYKYVIHGFSLEAAPSLARSRARSEFGGGHW